MGFRVSVVWVVPTTSTRKPYSHSSDAKIFGEGIDKFIFFLGAGASVDAGLPTAFAMTEKFIKVVQEKSDEMLLRSLAFVLGGIHMYHGQRGRLPQSQVNVEELATMLNVMCSRYQHQLVPFVGAWNELLAQFDGSRSDSRDLLTELRELLQSQVKDWLDTPPIGKIRYLQTLQDFTIEFGTIDIFTLNYDLCVERALNNCNIAYTCGFTSGGWDTAEFTGNEYRVRLYKLHGSLDWYHDDEDQMIYSMERPPVGRIPAESPLPLLIFGLVNKLKPVDPFLHLSYTFSERVKQAKVIVIIGYGFGDEYINQIIQQGLSRDSRKRLIVVGFRMDDTKKSFLQQFDPSGVLIAANRVDFLDGGTAKVLLEGILMEKLKASLTEATEEGPF